MSIYGPCLKPTAAVAVQQKEGVDLRQYAKRSYVNHRLQTRVAVSGDVMAGDLDMNGFRITNLPEAPKSPKDACSTAFVNALGTQYVKRDGSQSMRADLGLGGYNCCSICLF